MKVDTEKLRRDVAGFAGRFFYDEERGDLAYVAKNCDDRKCECGPNYNIDGDQDCSVPVCGFGGVDEAVGEPVARMLNSVGPLLDEIERLRSVAYAASYFVNSNQKGITQLYDSVRDRENGADFANYRGREVRIEQQSDKIGNLEADVKDLEQQLAAMTAARDEALRDARRYWRLQVLGCAPSNSEHLNHGLVLRFSNLDAHVDADIAAHPSRGESQLRQVGVKP